MMTRNIHDVHANSCLTFILTIDIRVSSGMALGFSFGKTVFSIFQPVHEKTDNLGLRPGPAQTGMYSHRATLKASNFGYI